MTKQSTGCLGEGDQSPYQGTGCPWKGWEGVGRGGKGWEGVGGPLPPSLVAFHDALRGSKYIGHARPRDVTPSFELVLG